MIHPRGAAQNVPAEHLHAFQFERPVPNDNCERVRTVRQSLGDQQFLLFPFSGKDVRQVQQDFIEIHQTVAVFRVRLQKDADAGAAETELQSAGCAHAHGVAVFFPPSVR